MDVLEVIFFEKQKNMETYSDQHSHGSDQEKPQVYKIETDINELKKKCALCLSLPCCPEHCCNWDSCDCTRCQHCMS